MFHLNIMIYVDVTLMLFTFNYNKVKIYNVRMVCCAGTIYHFEKFFKTLLQYEKHRLMFCNQESFIYNFKFMSDMNRHCLCCKYFAF